ncbi:MAG: hypothetical protein COU35_03945 [Candidatus Magasanikbacteria bacterium CG10_big_fil_rev_8_21_14_0_10_47_10]|uniref:Uncharacterized protein n=1 Tax=Candidatus Magasanikbacteria bacterium CG10_big_fil_rev_8_21_14_0_10_47_10 TaxID=1974652 RepID=A0A2H0TPU6_9BACT|nr:MAG: hypothetical protein COU35_03945 [Candidatus Magasanikbacteria bacterium CG10_big_fil_rev_8_21_14_0_10_47_10]
MNIESLKRQRYSQWDDLCNKSNDAWFWHTSGGLQYQLAYAAPFEPVDRSFVVVHDGQIVGGIPLIEMSEQGTRVFGLNGQPGPNPIFAPLLGDKQKKKAQKMLFEELDGLATDHGVKRCAVSYSPLMLCASERNTLKANPLVQFGFLDTSWISQCMLLDAPLDSLKKGIRHGHQYDLKRGEKVLRTEIFDASVLTRDIYVQYENLHEKAAGRKTRSSLTFDMMENFIRDRNAFLIGAKQGENWVGFAYFYIYNKHAYLGSACNDPDASTLPIAHCIQWAAIEYMHRQQVSSYEVGWQDYGPTLLSVPSQKEIDISKFKRGFGGEPVTVFAGEKYYDKEYFLEVYTDRMNAYKQTII